MIRYHDGEGHEHREKIGTKGFARRVYEKRKTEIRDGRYFPPEKKIAIRFDEMFEGVILPLRGTRNVNVESDFTEETATTFRKHRYAFRNIDIILLEGIFLFKPMYRDHFDLKVWIDCSFAAALRRAMARGQEGLPPQEAKRVFETIHFSGAANSSGAG